LAAAAALLALTAAGLPTPAGADLLVFDPANQVVNALQAARQLESLTNEAQMLLNQAHELAASPYSHLLAASRTFKDMADLARSIRGVAATVEGLEKQFADLYPTAVEGLDPRHALDQARGRAKAARDTAQDLARTAAELERLSPGRDGRLKGALAASEAADGQTAAVQSSTQMLAVLAEDLGALRTGLLAQSRLMSEEAARQAAERAAGAEIRRRWYARDAAAPAPPAFDPFARRHE
jgi:P-type conjugative transfer protein TrbJ